VFKDYSSALLAGWSVAVGERRSVCGKQISEMVCRFRPFEHWALPSRPGRDAHIGCTSASCVELGAASERNLFEGAPSARRKDVARLSTRIKSRTWASAAMAYQVLGWASGAV
jgi:hypothetical protein